MNPGLCVSFYVGLPARVLRVVVEERIVKVHLTEASRDNQTWDQSNVEVRGRGDRGEDRWRHGEELPTSFRG